MSRRSAARSVSANSTIPIAIRYTRVSSNEQRDSGVSLDAQAERTTAYVGSQGGWQLEPHVYTDTLSGLRDERAGYQALLAELRRLRANGHNVVVVVMRFDRFGRDIAERVRAWRELRDLDVPIHSVTEGGVVTELAWNIYAAMAQDEVRKISERTSEAWEHIMGAGWHMVGKRPYGYRWRERTPEEKAQGAPDVVLESEPVEAAHVLEAFQRVAAGHSARSVGRWLAGLPASERGGRLMRWRTVQHILRSSTYVGRMDADGAGRWPAIVDEATWTAVQQQLDGHAHRPRQASTRYLLTGLIYCPRCDSRMQGAHMTAGTAGVRPVKVLRYRCGSHVRGDSEPRCNVTASAPTIDAFVLEHVGALVSRILTSDDVERRRVERKWNALRQPPVDARDVERKRRTLTAQIEAARLRIGGATELRIAKQIEQDAYELVCAKARQEIADANVQLGTLQVPSAPTLPTFSELMVRARDWQMIVASGTPAQIRDVLVELVTRVTPVRVSHATYAPHIVWTDLAINLDATAAGTISIAA